MSHNNVVLSLGHALIAAAWADGKLDASELQSLKDLLFGLPGLRPEHWAELQRRAEVPVDSNERQRLIDSLAHQIDDERDRRLVLDALDRLLSRSESFGKSERAAIQEIRSAIEEKNESTWGGLKRLFQSSLRPRARAGQSAAELRRRIEGLQDTLNREVEDRLEPENADELDERELKRLCLAGSLMAHVAKVDRHVDEGERKVMVDALRDGWGLRETVARAVVQIMIVHGGDDLDLHRSLREFFEITTEAERSSFLDVLFAVAAADGMVSVEEQEEIRLICMGLMLSNVHYVAAKTRVPESKRAL